MKMKKQCLMIKNRKIVILYKNVHTKFVITIKNKKTVHTFDFLLYNIFMKKIMVYGNNMKGNNGMGSRIYVCIDLKSFYASVECIERNLDPLDTHLVVADASRTEKTICLAVSPSLKKYGISGRARLFEVVQKLKQVNNQRLKTSRYFRNESFLESDLKKDEHLKISYIIATPRMSHYMEWSKKIYKIYLKYVSPEDIHVYSIDEVFMDITKYLSTSKMTPKEFASQILLDIYDSTGLTATAGIGTNLYLSKVAMDIVAKHINTDQNGLRIALLNEKRYRKYLWNHRPLTDFWRVGKGYAKKLEKEGLYTMGDIAKCSVGADDEYYNEKLLYDLFGVNAELLIDHAWGYESCTMQDIKRYKPERNSIGTGQVLSCPYNFEKTKLIVKEMLDLLALDLVGKSFMTNQIVLTIGYDKDNDYEGEMMIDRYNRKIPKHAHGTIHLDRYTSSSKLITKEVMKKFDVFVNKKLLVKRINITACNVIYEEDAKDMIYHEQLDLFTNNKDIKSKTQKEKQALEKEKRLQKATIQIKQKYGKNAILKGMNLEEGATTKERNEIIGGHKA